ncbi:MAG: hypothetical protein KGI89_00005 [Euryarchaeota archaeon]|nr:hypothetical protein [Euryarchaeota archaeon]
MQGLAASTIDGPLLSAIENAGLLGITSKQLASTTGRPVVEVEATLRRLSQAQRVLRVGKGLWILPRYKGQPGEESDVRGPSWYLDRFLKGFELPGPDPFQGEIQFNPNEELPVHRWWPYVQGFSAEFVRRTCEAFDIGPGKVVLDPFAGSGTVSVEARLRGAQTIASELMPVAAMVIRAKHLWTAAPSRVRSAARKLVVRARRGTPAPPPFLRETSRQFAPGALDSLLRMRAELERLPAGEVRSLLELAFAGVLVASSRLKRSPCLGYARKPEVGAETPYQRFLGMAELIATDLTWLKPQRGRFGPPAQVLEENSKQLDLPEASVDLAITSPPYVNGMDYVMNYKLEMAWLGQVRSYEDLARLKSDMVACDNVSPSVISAHEAGRWVKEDGWLSHALGQIEENIASKTVYRRRDMAEIVAKYFDDLVPVIVAVHRALRPGGKFVVVNGDSWMAGSYVPGDLLFGRLAVRAGFEVEKFEVARARRSGQRRDFLLRESVLTLRKGAS